MSFNDRGVVFFDANFRSSSISTPTVFSDIVSNGEDRDIDIVSSDDVDDKSENDDETTGFVHPEAVDFLFLDTIGLAVAWVCVYRSAILRDGISLFHFVPFAESVPPIPLTRQLLVKYDDIKSDWIEFSTLPEKNEAAFRFRPCSL